MPPATIDLDNNATTPLDAEVAAAMAQCHAAGYANPESQHAAGRRARAALEDAREALARLLGADLTGRRPDRLIFTSGGTEANNLALFGLAGREPARVVVSAIEHPSVAKASDELAARGFDVERLPATADGLALLDPLDDTPPARVASLMLVNNETGVIQPVARFAQICAARRTLIHTDAVQALGKIPLDFRQLGVDAMTVAAHKLHGPRGIGALIVRHGVELAPLTFGGSQQQALRPGTEDVALAVGFLKAVEVCHRQRDEAAVRMLANRERFEERLRAGVPEIVIHGESLERAPNTSNISFPGLDRQQLFVALDLAGVACSTGSACASGSSDPSPTLVAMGRPESEIGSSLRFSASRRTTVEEIDEAASRILNVCNQLRRAKSPRKMAPTGRRSE